MAILPTPQDLLILKQRATELAKVDIKDKEAANVIEVLFFDLGKEKYGIETVYIKEVFPLKNCTPLPLAPKMIHGVTNIRRKILMVIDLKAFFEIEPIQREKKILIVLGQEEMEYALIIDNFSHIEKIPVDKLQMTLSTLTGIRQEYLKGLLADGTVILDGKKLLKAQFLATSSEDL